MPSTPNAPLFAAAAILALAAAAPASAQRILDTEDAEIAVPDDVGQPLPQPGIAADRDVLPETDGTRGLEEQLSVGTVEDETVLPGQEEDVLRGAGVGLRERGVGEVEPQPGAGLRERERTIMNEDMGTGDDDGL